jgi:hypothetical protein
VGVLMPQVNYSNAKGLDLITSKSFSTVSSTDIDNCFSASYSQYKIITLVTGSNDVNLGIRLKTGGTIYSTGNQRRQITYADNTSLTSGRYTTETYMLAGVLTSNAESCGLVEIMNPFQSGPTTSVAAYSFRPIGSIIYEYNTGGIPGSDSFDGFRLLPSSGTITGEIYVYGYVNS